KTITEVGLWFGLRREIDKLPGESCARRTFWHVPIAHVVLGAIPDDLKRLTSVDHFLSAGIPHCHHVNFAIADQLLRLRSLCPPDLDIWLYLIQFAEGPVDVERVQLVCGHAICQEC